MHSSSLREKLRDPAYLDLHFIAATAMRDIGQVPWYDAHFLKRFAAARSFLGTVRPDLLSDFEAGFAPLIQAPNVPARIFDNFHADDLHRQIKEIASEIPRKELELHEVKDFGRHVVHNHEFFSELQTQIMGRIEDIVGCKLAPGYNFLSLYGGAGKCDPHMDEPISMYTLDYCIDQNEDWPIHFSNKVEWPDAEDMAAFDPSKVLNDPELTFESKILQPNQALIFTGSSHWHYRNSIPKGGFCNLLFFHYYPADCGDLVRPAHWARHFGWAELEPLCDLFAETAPTRNHAMTAQ